MIINLELIIKELIENSIYVDVIYIYVDSICREKCFKNFYR